MNKKIAAPHDELTVHECCELIKKNKQKGSADLTVKEWNRLRKAEQVHVTDSGLDSSILIVFNPRQAWKRMKNTHLECISINAIYNGRHVFLFRYKDSRKLPW